MSETRKRAINDAHAESQYDAKLQKQNVGVTLADIRNKDNLHLGPQPSVFAPTQQTVQQQVNSHPVFPNFTPQSSQHQLGPQPNFSNSTFPPHPQSSQIPTAHHISPSNFPPLNASLLQHPEIQMFLRHYQQDEGDKSAGQCNLSDADLSFRFPTLVSNNYFKENPSYVYLKMSTLAKEEMARSSSTYNAPKSILDKLDQNKKRVLIETFYESGVDNLDDKLHDVRFSRGVITPATKLFQLSAEKIKANQVLIL